MARLYEATLDNGHDFSHIEFESEHRADSKANKEDCKRRYIKLHGFKMWRGNKIIQTRLIYR